jgi:hypothetical protein
MFNVTQPGCKIPDGPTLMPDSLPCTIEALSFEGIYLIDEGVDIHLLVFESSNQEDVEKVTSK